MNLILFRFPHDLNRYHVGSKYVNVVGYVPSCLVLPVWLLECRRMRWLVGSWRGSLGVAAWSGRVLLAPCMSLGGPSPCPLRTSGVFWVRMVWSRWLRSGQNWFNFEMSLIRMYSNSNWFEIELIISRFDCNTNSFQFGLTLIRIASNAIWFSFELILIRSDSIQIESD